MSKICPLSLTAVFQKLKTLSFYTDKHLNWNRPLQGLSFSIDLSVTVALSHLVERLKAFHYKCSRVYNYQIPRSKYVFQIERYNKPSLFVDLYPHETLAELHAAVRSAIKMDTENIQPFDCGSNVLEEPQKRQVVDIHDIFVCKNKTSENESSILSIHSNKIVTLLELIEFNPDHFVPAYTAPIRKIYKLYLIETDYDRLTKRNSLIEMIGINEYVDHIPRAAIISV